MLRFYIRCGMNTPLHTWTGKIMIAFVPPMLMILSILTLMLALAVMSYVWLMQALHYLMGWQGFNITNEEIAFSIGADIQLDLWDL